MRHPALFHTVPGAHPTRCNSHAAGDPTITPLRPNQRNHKNQTNHSADDTAAVSRTRFAAAGAFGVYNRRMLAFARARLHYGWVIFVLSLGNLTVEGGTKNSESVYFLALRDAFGRSATYTSAVFSTAGLIGALSAPLLGILLDRWGARVLFPLAGLLILFGWLASSYATDLWQMFFFYGIFAGIGHTAISSFSMTATLAPWFPQTRGRMLGLADSGNPIGQAIFAPLAGYLTVAIGWRPAFRIFGVIFAVLIALPNGLLQRRPQESTAMAAAEPEPGVSETTLSATASGPASDAPASRRPSSRQTPALSNAVRDPTMWLLVLTRITGSVGVQLIRVHLVSFFVLAGYTAQSAANTMGAVGLVSLFARPMVGLATDRWGRESVYTVGMSVAAGAVLFVLYFGDGASFWPLVVYVLFAGITDGISGLIVGAKAADLFPSESLGTVMGFVEMGRGAAIFLGPIIGGIMFDLQGDYVQAFVLSAGLTFVSVCAMWVADFTGRRRGRG